TLQAAASDWRGLEGTDLAKDVSCTQTYDWTETDWALGRGYGSLKKPKRHVVAVDFGAKRNILRCLVSAGFDVTVVPANTPASDVLAMQPAGVFLSNGPGDPSAVKGGIAEVAKLIDANMPIFGICLGHQILANALGAQTYKMKFGHHGANHPVVEIDGGRIDITSQNHGFAVDPDSMASAGLELTHRNGNDDTVEGMRHLTKPVFSVQYHPEAAPGPHDPGHLFHRFREMVAGVSC
ncbi:MAG: carbamoyl phosphate synthase small subunit, partial [Planctomycetes bacterium]|nr:carbamoyl phosphate synthase small subunit [Planctomycetota bacterium]